MRPWYRLSLGMMCLAVVLIGCVQAEPVVLLQTRVTTPTLLLQPAPTATAWVITATPEPSPLPITIAVTPLPMVRMGFYDPASNGDVEAGQRLLAETLGELANLQVQPVPMESTDLMVAAVCAGELDLAWLATPAYLVAHDDCGAEALFRGIRHGTSWHRGQILVQSAAARRNAGLAPIDSLADLSGLTMAYTQQESTSGHYLPQMMLYQSGIELGQALYTSGDRQAVLALYRSEVDAAATYWLPLREDGSLGDARTLLADTLPDVGERLEILLLTPAIPNDPLVCRADLAPSLRQALEAGLAQLARSADGRQMLMALYGLEGLEPAADADYDGIREMGVLLDIDWRELVR